MAIKSAKHFGSSAFHYLHNMKRVRSLLEFGNSFQSDGVDKIVVIVTVVRGFGESGESPS